MLFDDIDFVRIQSGLWQITVGGLARPVTIVRSGRRWYVQTADLRYSRMETQHPRSSRTLAEAKQTARFAWLALAATRELARYEAQEQELRRLFRLARELGITFPIAVGGTDKEPVPLFRQIAYVKARIEDKYKVLHGPAI